MEFKNYEFVPEPGVFYLNAGDTHAAKISRLSWLSRYNHVMFSVLGNHDYYYKWPDTVLPDAASTIRTYDHEGLKIAGATMWTDLGNPLDWDVYCSQLIDQRAFPYRISHEIMVEWHEEQKRSLFESGADVIVTHHAPSYKSMHPRYFGNPLNPGFMTELAQSILLMEHPPKLWVHGHVHDPFDYQIGSTRVVCNPRGYPGENGLLRYEQYQPKIIEI